ncbi:MAG TPA: helicase-related protein [Nitrososphaeraceae archaeon]
MTPAISGLKFPFRLKNDQYDAVSAWLNNDCRGSVIFSTGTGKTEIAFECARRMAASVILPHKLESIGTDALELAPPDQFRILFLVPRIVLLNQNVGRLLKYGISPERVGVFFGERKDIREITISTYQSVINNLGLIRNSNLVILDEIHLVTETATEFSKIFWVINEDPRKGILGLTATIDEKDPKYSTILSLAPPVKRYMIRDAVYDGRLARPEIIPITVNFSREEQKIYEYTSRQIRELSRKLGQSDPMRISMIVSKGGYRSKLAKSWFENVRKRKELLSCAINKLLEVVKIVRNHSSEPIMIFSETISSIKRLEELLSGNGIKSRVIHNRVSTSQRKEILSQWGTDFFPLLSVHTLEMGYDVPHVRIAIIIANSSNINQIAQRIGRVIRKAIGKDDALIYIIYVRDTKDNNILKIVKSTINLKEPMTKTSVSRKGSQKKLSDFYS